MRAAPREFSHEIWTRSGKCRLLSLWNPWRALISRGFSRRRHRQIYARRFWCPPRQNKRGVTSESFDKSELFSYPSQLLVFGIKLVRNRQQRWEFPRKSCFLGETHNFSARWNSCRLQWLEPIPWTVSLFSKICPLKGHGKVETVRSITMNNAVWKISFYVWGPVKNGIGSFPVDGGNYVWSVVKYNGACVR